MRYLVAIVLLSFGVNGEYFNDKLGSDYDNIQKKTDEKYDVHYWWQKSRNFKNWYPDVLDDKYPDGKKVTLGYDEKYETEFRVNEEEVKDESNFIHPCALSDRQCIRKFFAHNSHCDPAHDPAPDPIYIARNTHYLSNSNLTLTWTNYRVTGLSSAEVSAFYANKHTGNLVFAILVRKLNYTSSQTFVRYRRTGKESIVLADVSGVEFDSITFTAEIPTVKSSLRLDLADIHADVHDGNPKFYIGPKIYRSLDPDVIAAYASLILNLQTTIKESFEYDARMYTALFIQQTICDFGLKIRTG